MEEHPADTCSVPSVHEGYPTVLQLEPQPHQMVVSIQGYHSRQVRGQRATGNRSKLGGSGGGVWFRGTVPSMHRAPGGTVRFSLKDQESQPHPPSLCPSSQNPSQRRLVALGTQAQKAHRLQLCGWHRQRQAVAKCGPLGNHIIQYCHHIPESQLPGAWWSKTVMPPCPQPFISSPSEQPWAILLMVTEGTGSMN